MAFREGQPGPVEEPKEPELPGPEVKHLRMGDRWLAAEMLVHDRLTEVIHRDPLDVARARNEPVTALLQTAYDQLRAAG